MAVETKAVSCPSGSYTALATAKTNVTFRMRTRGMGRMVVAASQPAANVTDYFTVSSLWQTELGSLSGTENVYFMPEGSDAVVVEVLRG